MARWAAFRAIPTTVHAAALLFAAVLVGFLVLSPTFYGYDEPQHVDQIYAASNGDLISDPGEALVSEGVAEAQEQYVEVWPYQANHSYTDYSPIPRGDRPSLIELGGHSKDSPGGYSNQMAQHPPLYYGSLGAFMWLVPGDASMPADQFVASLRLLNIILLLPLPYLLWWGTRKLTGDGPVAQAAAFVPVLIPGLGRLGATVNNDNLLILATTVLLGFVADVTKGDLSRRTAWAVSGLLVVCLLTKGNALVLPLIVGAAYLVGWRRAGGRVPWRPALIVAIGGAIGGVWWLRNLVEFGAVQPNGFGNRNDTVNGPVRLPADPASFETFSNYVQDYLPQRFWGGLGLLEPPALPGWLIIGLSVLLLGSLIVAFAVARGNRLSLIVLSIGAPVMVGLILQSSWSHFQNFTIIPGVQGRYGYPSVLGISAIIAIGVGAALRRAARLTPLVLLTVGVVVEGVAAYVVVQHSWLPIGQAPRPGNVRLAFETIAAYAPWPTAVTALLVLGVIGGALTSIVLTARSVGAQPRGLRCLPTESD